MTSNSISHGRTIRKLVACGKMKVIVNVDKEKNVIEDVVLKLPKAGICHCNISATVELTNDMISLGHLKRAIKGLRGHTCTACTSLRYKQKHKEVEVTEKYGESQKSCPDAIARALLEVQEELDKKETKK